MPAATVMADGYGRLRNLGPGAATDVTVTFIPDNVARTPRWDAPPTHRAWEDDPLRLVAPSVMRAYPSHVAHNETARINDLPSIVVWDIDQEVSYVGGTVRIACRDIMRKHHEFTQRFIAIPRYDATPPRVDITFHGIGSTVTPEGAHAT